MTGLMDTPAKGLAHGSINKNGNVGEDAAGKLFDLSMVLS
jgi:hypothetical protein